MPRDISRDIIVGVIFLSSNSTPMSEAMYYILLSLIRPNHGYQVMAAVREVSGGRLNIGPGTLYGVLTRMLGDKLIEIMEDDGRRKVYAITKSGRAALIAEYGRIQAMARDGQLLEEDMNG